MKNTKWHVLSALIAAALLCAALAVGAFAASETYDVVSPALFESAHNYADDSDITWNYSYGGGADFLLVTFSSKTETEEYSDYIRIYNTDYDRRYHGAALAGQTLIIPGNSFSLQLTSDSTYSCYGFKITSIVGNRDTTDYVTVGGVLYNKDKTELLAYPAGRTDASLTLPSTVTSIAADAFENASNLTDVYLPGSRKQGDYFVTYFLNAGLSLNLHFTGDTRTVKYPALFESSHNYEDESEFTWNYSYGGTAKSLSVTFSDSTEVEANYDFIEISVNGNSFGVYTGVELAGQTLVIPGNSFSLTLRSDESFNFYGFQVTKVTPELVAATEKTFTVRYHSDDDAAASGKTTTVVYGAATKTLSIAALGFAKTGYTFTGWKAYNETDDTWRAKDASGVAAWVKLTNGRLPSGYSYHIYPDEQSVSKLVESGTVHFYAQWKANTYIVKYHGSDTAAASGKTTTATYGTETKTITASALGFSKSGYTFNGWKAYNETVDAWRAKNSSGEALWVKLTNGSLPTGYSYYLYPDGQAFSKVVTSGTVHLYAQWKANTYAVKYHSADGATASGKTTKVTYGTPTKTLTAAELGFTKAGYIFAGWKACNETDGTWRAKNASGGIVWAKLTNGKLPSGYTYYIYPDGQVFNQVVESGTVHLYAQWKENANTYTVKYHSNDTAAASSKTTTVTYGISTKTLTAAQLGFSKTGYTFAGWKAYSEVDGAWRAKNASGTLSWQKLVNGKLPTGYTYYTYPDGQAFSKVVESGTVHLYAQWKENTRTYTVRYHSSDTAAASGKTTTVTYGTSTKTLTTSQLGFTKAGYTFTGWKAYNETDGTWRAKNASGSVVWAKLTNGKLPTGYNYYIYPNGQAFSKVVESGTVHLYAQWKANTYTVKYHSNDTATASSKTTTVTYGVSTKTLTTSQLGFTKAGYTFSGWKAYNETDGTWRAKNASGGVVWVKLTNGKLPTGYSYYIYPNGQAFSQVVTSGTIHLYAQWA